MSDDPRWGDDPRQRDDDPAGQSLSRNPRLKTSSGGWELTPPCLACCSRREGDPPLEDRWNAACGCKTSEVSLAILSQVAQLEQPRQADSADAWEALLLKALAMVAELQPVTATEALLAAQMVGAQRLAMTFLRNATREGQTVQGADANILRATRLMRLFNEQVETMARLKGKGVQQRVVVEHVTVAAGGQAIVGTMIRGEGGAW